MDARFNCLHEECRSSAFSVRTQDGTLPHYSELEPFEINDYLLLFKALDHKLQIVVVQMCVVMSDLGTLP